MKTRLTKGRRGRRREEEGARIKEKKKKEEEEEEGQGARAGGRRTSRLDSSESNDEKAQGTDSDETAHGMRITDTLACPSYGQYEHLLNTSYARVRIPCLGTIMNHSRLAHQARCLAAGLVERCDGAQTSH